MTAQIKCKKVIDLIRNKAALARNREGVLMGSTNAQSREMAFAERGYANACEDILEALEKENFIFLN